MVQKLISKLDQNNSQETESISILRMREEFRDQYLLEHDPIYEDRLLWRAQTFRHMVHLLPKQSILELGCGQGLLTRQLLRISRGENPITSVSFNNHSLSKELSESIEFYNSPSLNEFLTHRYFDCVISVDLIDRRNCAWFLENVYKMLKPGGQAIFYESNPRNLILKARSFSSRLFGKGDPRKLLSRSELFESFARIGFNNLSVLYNDFVYAPLTSPLIWILRNLSILFENTPGMRTLAGSILIHAQKPPRVIDNPQVSLCEHKKLWGAVSVVIPCHNEETNVEPMITKLESFFGEYIYEIIPVEDNSTDKTGEVIRKLANLNPVIKPIYRNPPNGVGRAIADGLSMAKGEYVLTLDCDFHQILPEIRDMFDAAAKGYDVVIGSRFSPHSVLLNYPFKKIIANRCFHLLAQTMFLRGFRDLTNNLKLMRKEVVDRLRLRQNGFAVNAETGFQPLLMGYKLKEVPLSWIGRTPEMGMSKFSLLRAGFGYLSVLLRLWLKQII